jgi:hypothetical protein
MSDLSEKSEPKTPFDNIESAHEYVRLLAEAVGDAAAAIDEEIRQGVAEGGGRRLEALQLVAYKLERLRGHMAAAGYLLNDLRTLRRLLLGERLLPGGPSPAPTTPAQDDEVVAEGLSEK